MKPTDLAPTPPMGFNTWNHFGDEIDERLVDEILEALLSSGLADLGYRYLNLDDGWMEPARSASGSLRPHQRRFPGGIPRLVEQVHGAGLRFGIYSDCGTRTCAGYAGSYGYEQRDAELFAEWDVDYVKHDWCYVPLEDFPGWTVSEVAAELYGRMANGLAKAAKPIVLSVCNWGQGEPWEWAGELAHLWRTTGDIEDRWAEGSRPHLLGVTQIFRRNVHLARFAGPDGWNDPDMLEVGNGGMTDTEYRSHFALWCMMAAPLLVGCDVRRMSEETREILGNRRLIAIDQDPLGSAARLVERAGSLHTLARPLADGGLAVAVFNEGEQAQEVSVRWRHLADVVGVAEPVAGSVVEDCWSGTTAPVRGGEEVALAPHATAVWRIRPPAPVVGPSD